MPYDVPSHFLRPVQFFWRLFKIVDYAVSDLKAINKENKGKKIFSKNVFNAVQFHSW